MKSKQLLLGNAAVARGLYEAGVRFVSSYPGTPSTEITEFAAQYSEIYCEWAPNEKVALEGSIGASFAGARSFSAMKHVGLNVAADPLFTASYTGVGGGLVIAVADDPGMHSSQNEQDSRNYARASKTVMLEPSDSQECKDFAKAAYYISEKFNTPVLLRLHTRISHSQSEVTVCERENVPLKEYVKDQQTHVMIPAFARMRHIKVEERMCSLADFSASSELNRTETHEGSSIGVITSGMCYNYAKEALGDRASYLKLGVIYPLSEKLIKEFCGKYDIICVVEELDGFLEDQIKAMGIKVDLGKNVFTNIGELTPATIKKAVLGSEDIVKAPTQIPGRPPVLCPGCPHRGMFYVLSKNSITVSGDIGCYTLGAQAPFSAIDWCVCMGASVSALHGYNKVREGKNSVAVIGDSTFLHSGITGLMNIVYNNSESTVIIADNSITGMTGHQENPSTGRNIKGDPAHKVSLEKLCEAVGVRSERIRVVNPDDIEAFESILKEELAVNEPSVIISRRPCVLLKNVKPGEKKQVLADKCRGCRMCMKAGCPAITFENGKAFIDPNMCAGCEVCRNICRFGAIEKL